MLAACGRRRHCVALAEGRPGDDPRESLACCGVLALFAGDFVPTLDLVLLAKDETIGTRLGESKSIRNCPLGLDAVFDGRR